MKFLKVKSSKVKNKKSSIRVKLIVVPLILVLIAIGGIGSLSSYFMRESLLDEMERNGFYLSEKIISRMEDNSKSIETINELLDEKIRTTSKMIIRNKENLDNKFLKNIVNEMDVAQINWHNSDGVIEYSTVDEYIGWSPSEDHPIANFIKSDDQEMIEEIRKDSESDAFLKYGYMKIEDGSFVQVGILADKVTELTERFDYQNLLEEMASSDEIAYALFMDKNLKTIGHSNKDEIGIVFDDEGSKGAAIDGVPYSQQWYYEEEDITVYDIIFPAVIDGEHIGAIAVGYSLENTQNSIDRNIQVIAISGIIAFIVLGMILFSTSNYAIKTINKLKEQLNFMAAGDFSNDVPEDLLNKKDEFGEISKSVQSMQSSIRDMVKSVLDKSQIVAAHSEELTATTEQSSRAADEVSRAIEAIASGASEQAKDTEQGFASVTELGNVVIQNSDYVQDLNISTEKVNQLKNEGSELIKDLVEKTDMSSKSAKQVQEVIINTNKSAEKIASASEMIKSIAEQTNLLALNAAIEAARAGDAGRGFAVVADEIRNLAEQSNQFTEEISTIINDLTDKTSSAVQTMEEVGKIAESQSTSVDMTSNKFDGIAKSLEEMKEAIDQVNSSSTEMTNQKETIMGIIENLSAISQENAAGSQEASASVEEQTASMIEISNSSEELAKIAEELKEQIEQFKI